MTGDECVDADVVCGPTGLELIRKTAGLVVGIEVASREIRRNRRTTRSHDGIRPSSMCIAFGDDAQKDEAITES